MTHEPFRARAIGLRATADPLAEVMRTLRRFSAFDPGLRDAMGIYRSVQDGEQPVLLLPNPDIENNPISLYLVLTPAEA